jgi:hypothetical protein
MEKGRQTFVVVPLKRTWVNFTEKWEEDSCRCVVGHLFVSNTKTVYENNGGRNCYQSENCTVILLLLYFVNNMFEPCTGWMLQIMCPLSSSSSPLEKVGRAMRSVTGQRGKRKTKEPCGLLMLWSSCGLDGTGSASRRQNCNSGPRRQWCWVKWEGDDAVKCLHMRWCQKCSHNGTPVTIMLGGSATGEARGRQHCGVCVC